METLLQGYDEQDEDQVYRVCNSPLLKYMDNDVSGAEQTRISISVKQRHMIMLQWIISLSLVQPHLKEF